MGLPGSPLVSPKVIVLGLVRPPVRKLTTIAAVFLVWLGVLAPRLVPYAFLVVFSLLVQRSRSAHLQQVRAAADDPSSRAKIR